MKIVLVTVLCLSALFAGVEKKIDFNTELPKDILEVAQKSVPEATFSSANTETEESYIVYEIQGTFLDGRKVEADILKNGDVEEIEIEFPTYMVPKAVLIQIEKKYPGFSPTYIEASHSKSMKVVQYEFEGEVNGVKLDLEVSADGRKIIESDQ